MDENQAHLDELSNEIFKGDMNLYVGSGLSTQYYISWVELTKRFKSECDVKNLTDFLEVAEVAFQNNPSKYTKIITEEFGKKPPDISKTIYPKLLSLPFKSIISPNIDPLLWIAAKAVRDSRKIFVFPSDEVFDHRNNVIMIHGLVKPGRLVKPDELMLRTRDYNSFYSIRRPLLPLLTKVFNDKKLLFMGCSLDEQDDIFEFINNMQKAGNLSEEPFQKRIMLKEALYIKNLVSPQLLEIDSVGENKERENYRARKMDMGIVRYNNKTGNHARIYQIVDGWCEKYSIIKREKELLENS